MLLQLEHMCLLSAGALPEARRATPMADVAPDPTKYNWCLRSTHVTSLKWGLQLDDEDSIDAAAAWRASPRTHRDSPLPHVSARFVPLWHAASLLAAQPMVHKQPPEPSIVAGGSQCVPSTSHPVWIAPRLAVCLHPWPSSAPHSPLSLPPLRAASASAPHPSSARSNESPWPSSAR